MNQLKRDAERKNLQQQTVDPNATYGEKIRQTGQNVREQIKYDQDIYGEGLSDSQVRQINKVVSEYVSQGDTLEDMQSRSYRMAQAMMYSNKLGISIQDAMEQLDSMNLATLGEAYNQNDDVGNFNALKNSFMLGINQIIGAHFGNMMSIHAAMGNQSGYDDYLLKLESLQRENQALSDPFKRNIAMEALKYGAQSAPFSIGTQLLSFIPEIGPALSFGASMWNSYGSLYADFRQKGAGHAESLGVATVAAGLDAFIEVSLGELAVNGAGELGETVFKKLTGKSREELVNKLTTEVFKRVKYNGALDNLLKESTKFVGSSIEEGIEEVLQYWNDELADATVAALSKDYDLEKLGGAERTKKIVKESAENFKGGFLGALTMGIPMQTGAHILNKAVLTSSINEARDVLSTVDSKVEAEKRLFNNPLFKGETDAETLENIDRHFDQYQFMRDQNYTKQAEELAELTQPAEGFAEAELDENGEPIATDAYRNAGGMLHVQDDVRENENGVTEGTYKVGNPSKKTKNLDGYIDYTLDEKNHTVEINKFIMSDTREDIRAEFFDRFAKDFAGYEIKWDPEGQRAIDLKNSLIKANPNGKNNGLSYYTDETTVADMQTRKNIAKQIKAAMPNLSNSQIAADVALLETVYKSLKKDNGYTSFTDYYQKTFGENIFGDKSVLEKSSIEQNGGKGVRGGVAFNQTEKSLRAVIYASEKADFSTWSHEIAHIFRQQLQGDLLREAETAFGVENGQWTRQNEEAFAEGFEKFLHTGQAQNNKLKNLFTKLAEFMARVYGALKGYVKFNPEVENVYNQLLKEGDDSVLAQAEKAVRENDKLIREEERQYAEEQKKAQSEVKAQEDFEKSETNYVEQEQEETVEDKDLDKEIQDMSITAEDGSIDKNKFKDFVDRVKAQAEQAMLADVEKRKQTIMETLEGIDQNVAEEIADIMTDPNSTAEDKQRAATLAGGLKKLEQIDLFQTMNYETVRYIANERVKGEIAFSLKQALELKNKGYSESAIASQTSWRYNNGDWTYEFDDNGMQVNFSTIRDTLKEMKERELDYFNGYGKVTLAQVMQHDKLYELFPEMKDIKVEFTSSNSRVKSLYDPKRNAIILNLKNRDLRMSLAAACQRYIQNLTQDITPSLELTADLNAEYQKVMAKYAWEKINGLDHKIDAIGVTQATKDYLADRLNQEVLNTANRWRMDHATRSFNKPGRADDSKKMYFQATKEEIAEANEYVKTFDPAERERIESNLKKHAGTPWHTSVVNALRARRDINSILETGIIPEGSIVNEVKNYREVLTDGATIEERTEHLWEYFECDSSLIGNPSKPLNAVASSFINCNPSSECAEYCYAVKGRSGLYNNILNRELINYLIEKDPARAAEDVADDYKATREYKNGVALRLLDTGDLSEPWLKFIEELNKRDISCQVFSKRPELLSKIDRNKNVVLLSIDKSNRDLAEQNPDLPIAFVYSGDEDRQFIIDNETRFTKYNGVILPVVMNHKRLTREEVAKLPKWSLNYTCPIDAGWKEIGSYKERKKDKGKWNCSVCDMNGQGCFFNRAVKDRQKFYATLKEMPNEYARSINEELKSESVRNKLKTFGLNESDIGSLLETVSNIVNEKLANVDTEGTGSGPGRYSETLSQTEENEGSQGSETGSQETGKVDLFQTAYHGSAANFDKFNTDEYGFSGEGSMSFGYGTYVSASEDIARDYAERQRPDKEETITYKGIKVEPGYLKALWIHLNQYDFNIQDTAAWIREDIEWAKSKPSYPNDFYLEYVAEREAELKLLESEDFNINDFNTDKPLTNLYTVDIPDDGYIVWDKDVDPKLAKTVKDAVFNKLTTEPNEDGDFEYKGVEKELQRELKDVFDNEMTGEQLYNNVAVYVGGERNASKLLNKLGIPGIDYPAGTNFGTPDGKEARNYVIFNDDDAKIIDHLLFQTEQELYDDARMFDNWQDFMEFYEYGFGKPSPTLVPEDPDAAWYQTTWEMAHNIKPESQENEEIVQSMVNEDKNNEDPAEAKDALFITKLQRPGELENFLSRIYDLRNMSEDMWTDIESEEDANERDKYTELQDYVKTYLNHGSLISNMSAVAQGKDLKESERQKIINLMSNNARNYREAYSKIMEDESLAVDITKEPGYRLSDPENNFVRKSFEERKRISEQVRNEDLAKEIRDGSLQMNDKLDKYIEYCDKQIKAAESEKRKAEQKLKDLNMEVQGDYQRIADWETRRLLELHDQLLMAKTKLKNHSDEVARRLDRGIKLTGKYDKTSQNLKANYDEIYRKFEDLRKTIEISEQVKAALKEREKYVEFKDKAKENQDEKKLIEKAKKMRIQLVKRAMRRVPFQKINYDQARTLIAIQRTLEPNLLGGVNKWIGQDQAYLRGVISSWITDEVERKKLTEYLKTKGTKTAMYVLDKLQETKTIEDFNAWTKQDRSKAHRVLPKENWIRELNLEQLAEEREKSIQLDITTREETRTVTGKDGNTQVLTLTRVEMSPELEQTIKEALGDKLFNQVMAVPFNEWTTEEMEELAKRIDDIYIEGRNLLAAKKQIRLEEAKAIRDAIESRLKDPGIYISEDDDDETKKRKYAKIEKILGKNNGFKGTTEGSKSLSLLDKIAYGDANVLRVGRILDNYDEAENVMELYRKEDQCYNDKARAINIRNKNIERVMKENNITVEELTDYYKLGNHKFTVDELLFFIAADADHEIDPTKKKQEINDPYNLAQNDDYAPTSRNAVMFGTMFSSSDDLDFKEECRKEDEEMQKRLENNELTADEKNLNTLGILVKKPGTLKYLKACKSRYAQVLNLAYSLDEKYLKLLEAINKDYADQYERMNKASIEYFNIPVNRVKAYVPLVRLESNGDTNENRVMEDLLGSQGIGKQWVDKGMTKSRVNIGPLNQKPVETGLYKTWNSSVERTEHFIAYSPYVQELNRVYKSRDAQYLRGYMENRYGKGMVKYIDNYINEVANPNRIAARNSLDNIVRSMRGKTAPAYLAWKASGIIKQAATSPWPYLQFVSPDKYIKACFDIIASKGKLYDEIKAISPYMNDRVMDPMIDLIEENIDKANNPISYGINKFGKMGMQGLEWIDWVCVSPGWLACYRDKYAELKKDNQFKYDQLVAELTEQNDNLDIISTERMTTEQIKQKADNMTMTESDIKDKAREYADDCTRKCQPSNRAVDLAPIFKAQGPGSEVGKALLQFQTSLNVIWQNIRYDLQYNAKQMGKSEIPMSVKKKMFSQICGITFAYVFAGIMMNAITDTPDEDDDKKDKVRKYMWYATTQFTDSVPVFGQALTSLSEQLITGKKSYESANDLFPMFTKFKNGIKFASGGNWSKAVSNFAEGLAMNFGLPTSGAKELLYAAGIGDKDGKLKFKPDAFIGRRRKEKK